MDTQYTHLYDSNAVSHPFIQEFLELIRYRDMVAQLIIRNIKTRYKRSALGVLWTMINPLMMTIILAFVFSNLFQSKQFFILHILSGVVVWNFFQQVTTHAMSELIWGGNLLNRIYLPKTVFAASALGTGLVNLVFSILPLFVAMVILKAPFKPSLLLLPVAVLLLAIFSLGVGLLLSTLSAGFTDVFEAYQIILSAWYFMTPILYPMEIISPQRQWLFNLNPIFSLLETFRAPILYGTPPTLNKLMLACLISLTSLMLGWWVFTRKADRLAYQV